MKANVALCLIGALLVGCSKGDPNLPGFKLGHGDAAAFILDSAISHGAHPIQKNNLPDLQGAWRFMADKDGIQIYLVGNRFAEVQSLLNAAFGTPAIAPKTNANGHISLGVYAAPTIGAAIQFLQKDLPDGCPYTHVVIVRSNAFRL